MINSRTRFVVLKVEEEEEEKTTTTQQQPKIMIVNKLLRINIRSIEHTRKSVTLNRIFISNINNHIEFSFELLLIL